MKRTFSQLVSSIPQEIRCHIKTFRCGTKESWKKKFDVVLIQLHCEFQSSCVCFTLESRASCGRPRFTPCHAVLKRFISLSNGSMTAQTVNRILFLSIFTRRQREIYVEMFLKKHDYPGVSFCPFRCGLGFDNKVSSRAFQLADPFFRKVYVISRGYDNVNYGSFYGNNFHLSLTDRDIGKTTRGCQCEMCEEYIGRLRRMSRVKRMLDIKGNVVDMLGDFFNNL